MTSEPGSEGTRPTLRQRERAFVRELLAGQSPRQAAIRAQMASPSNASRSAQNALARPRVQAALTAALERQGLSIDALGAKAAQLLEAGSETTVFVPNGRGGANPVAAWRPDYRTQLGAMRAILAALGMGGPKGGGVTVNSGGGPVQIVRATPSLSDSDD